MGAIFSRPFVSAAVPGWPRFSKGLNRKRRTSLGSTRGPNHIIPRSARTARAPAHSYSHPSSIAIDDIRCQRTGCASSMPGRWRGRNGGLGVLLPLTCRLTVKVSTFPPCPDTVHRAPLSRFARRADRKRADVQMAQCSLYRICASAGLTAKFLRLRRLVQKKAFSGGDSPAL